MRSLRREVGVPAQLGRRAELGRRMYGEGGMMGAEADALSASACDWLPQLQLTALEG